jgi:probable selenium-dependent hydroxylase accessory protein YqeC
LVSERLPEGKLKGLSPNVLEGLAVSRPEVTILIEADGSRQKPLKFPNATEPVVPKMTSLVVAVAGIDALGRELSGENVFRAEIAARLLNLSLGEIVTSERMAALLTHPQGILKETPPGARVVLFINKMDLSAVTKDGEDLIQSILTHSSSPVCRIVLGSAVAGVIERHVFV